MSNRVTDNGWGNSVRYAIYHHSSDCLLRGVLLSGWRVRVWFRWVAGSAQPGAVGGRNLRITLWLVGQPAGSSWAVPWADDLEHDAAETQMSVRTSVPNTRNSFLCTRVLSGFLALQVHGCGKREVDAGSVPQPPGSRNSDR